MGACCSRANPKVSGRDAPVRQSDEPKGGGDGAPRVDVTAPEEVGVEVAQANGASKGRSKVVAAHLIDSEDEDESLRTISCRPAPTTPEAALSPAAGSEAPESPMSFVTAASGFRDATDDIAPLHEVESPARPPTQAAAPLPVELPESVLASAAPPPPSPPPAQRSPSGRLLGVTTPPGTSPPTSSRTSKDRRPSREERKKKSAGLADVPAAGSTALPKPAAGAKGVLPSPGGCDMSKAASVAVLAPEYVKPWEDEQQFTPEQYAVMAAFREAAIEEGILYDVWDNLPSFYRFCQARPSP